MRNSTFENKTVNTFLESSMTENSFNNNRDYLLSSSMMVEFNTYRNWGDFAMRIMPWEKGSEQTVKGPDGKPQRKWVPDKNQSGRGIAKWFISNQGDVDLSEGSIPGIAGEVATKALFNNTHGIWENPFVREINNAPLLDEPEIREKMRQRNDCSIKALVEESKIPNSQLAFARYKYSDFMYCKHLGKMSNNYLLTLRRFNFPCSDYIMLMNPDSKDAKELQEHSPCVGMMVTWMGTPGNEMENILKYNVKMPFQEKTAKMEPVSSEGEGKGSLNALMNCLSGEYASNVLAGTHGTSVSGYIPFFGGDLASPPYEKNLSHTDENRVYGPVDVVKKTHIRGEEGLVYNHEISLTFDYELRSYDGINGKSAMLDLLGNVLAVCYATGTWWGGGRRGMGAGQNKAWTNLPIWKLGTGKYPMTFSGVTDALMDTCSSITKQYQTNNSDGSVMGALKGVLGNLASMFGGAMLNKLGRPQKAAASSLLTPEPTGFWHLTVGNPKNPIMTIGNLIMDSCEIQHYGPLGLDDFPTGLKVTVKLKPGKSRDIAEIEELYTWGDNRIYTPYSEGVGTIYEGSKQVGKNFSNDHTTDYTKTAGTTNRAENSKRVGAAIQGSDNKADGSPAVSDTASNTQANVRPDKPENSKKLNWSLLFFGVDSDMRRLLHAAMEQDQGSNPKTTVKPESDKN